MRGLKGCEENTGAHPDSAGFKIQGVVYQALHL